MYKLTNTCNETYAEEHQFNPMQWKIVHPQGKNVYKDVSGWIVCKDFFNDYAYTLNTGKAFTIYGYSAGNMQPANKDQDFYVALRKLCDEFFDNIKVLNDYLISQKLPCVSLSPGKKGEALLTIPRYYLNNTHHISLITLIIRLLNNPIKFADWDALCKHSDFEGGDSWKWADVVSKGVFFNIPDSLREFVYYVDKNYNSKTVNEGYQLASLVHNNGVISWQKAF